MTAMGSNELPMAYNKCPLCAYYIDPTDLSWYGTNYVEIECPNCEEPLAVEAITEFRFTWNPPVIPWKYMEKKDS